MENLSQLSQICILAHLDPSARYCAKHLCQSFYQIAKEISREKLVYFLTIEKHCIHDEILHDEITYCPIGFTREKECLVRIFKMAQFSSFIASITREPEWSNQLSTFIKSDEENSLVYVLNSNNCIDTRWYLIVDAIRVTRSLLINEDPRAIYCKLDNDFRIMPSKSKLLHYRGIRLVQHRKVLLMHKKTADRLKQPLDQIC